MRQKTFSSIGFEVHHKPTRREKFLAEMDSVVPWASLCALIEPHYPAGERGRPPIGIERMLRIYFLQQWFNMSDPQAEDSLYDSVAMRNFVGIDLGREAAPDETTICKFRHLIEEKGLGKVMLADRQRSSEGQWHQGRNGHDHGCHPDFGPVIDQE